MAKKAKETKVEATPQVVEQPKVETPVMENPKPKKDKWEIKNRTYFLNGKGRTSRLVYTTLTKKKALKERSNTVKTKEHAS